VKGSPLTQAEHDANHKEIGYIGANISSAATTDLNTVAGNRADVLGTATITSFGINAPSGTIRILRFQGALTITYNASTLILFGGVNFITKAGDILTFQKEAAAGVDGWRLIDVQTADGRIVRAAAITYNEFNAGATLNGAVVLNANSGVKQYGTVTGNITGITMTQHTDGGVQRVELLLTQDGTGGRTLGGLTFANGFVWKAGADKALSTGAGAVDLMLMEYRPSIAKWIVELMKGLA
jgi:hypothetical protein